MMMSWEGLDFSSGLSSIYIHFVVSNECIVNGLSYGFGPIESIAQPLRKA